jgi:hypothetical protein
MSAFLKIDQCRACGRPIPWEWAPVVMAGGKALAGTGVWRSQLIGGLCPACKASLDAQKEKEQRALLLRAKLVEVLAAKNRTGNLPSSATSSRPEIVAPTSDAGALIRGLIISISGALVARARRIWLMPPPGAA